MNAEKQNTKEAGNGGDWNHISNNVNVADNAESALGLSNHAK